MPWRLEGRFASTYEIMVYTKMMVDKRREAMNQTLGGVDAK